MRKNFLKTKSGYSLLEVILYIALTSIIIGAIASLVSVTVSVQARNFTISEVEQVGNQAMMIITQKIRTATIINSPSETSTAASLSINVSDPLKNPTVFSVSSSRLQIQEGATAAVFLTPPSTTVSSLSFSNVMRSTTKGSIRIQFTVSYVNTSGRQENTYSRIFYGAGNVR